MRCTEDCQRCGAVNFVWHVPSPLWNAVMRYPDGLESSEKLSIVCPRCFAEIAESVGVVSSTAIWHMDLDDGLLRALPLRSPDGRWWDQEQCLWVDSMPAVAR